MSVTLNTPGFSLTPAPKQVALSTNYITDFNFLNQYLPDTYEKEFERYGNRSVASLLRMTGAEMPTNSDLIKWTEQGRLHLKYTDIDVVGTTAGTTTAVLTIVAHALRKGQTVLISDQAGPLSAKAIITATTADTVTVAFYAATGLPAFVNLATTTLLTVFVYGSEFRKGTEGMEGSLEAQSDFLENKTIILKDNYTVNGSDMAQIGWVEVETANGSGYLWYLKSEHETRQRFEDYLETSMIEAVPAEATSGAAAALTTGGSEGLFYAIEDRGNVSTGSIDTLADIDTIVARLDKQGAIEENVLFLNRAVSFEINDMLAAQNNFGSSGASYGLFDNDDNMALNLGFNGFRRGYDFYKSDWKYLNDASMRGGIVGGAVSGVLIPAGSTSVYDQVLGKNAKRPFLHVRYRASETEDRKMKTWITGSAGGAATSSLDAMEVNFLSERALCTLGANNFFIFK